MIFVIHLRNFIRMLIRVLILNPTKVDEEHQQNYNVIQDNLKANHKALPY